MKNAQLFLLVIFAFYACKVDDQEPLSNTTRASVAPPVTWTAITEADVAREAIQWVEALEDNQISENAFYLKEGSMITVDSILHDSLPDTTIIQVSMNAVLGKDQRNRTGNLTIQSFGNWVDSTSNNFVVTLNNWMVDETVINGSFVLVPSIFTDSTSFSWRVETMNLTIISKDYYATVKGGLNMILQVGNPNEWMQDSATKLSHIQQVDGSVSGNHVNGQYSASYIDTLLFKYTCSFPQEGRIIVQEPSRTQVIINRDSSCSPTYNWSIDRTTGTGTFK